MADAGTQTMENKRWYIVHAYSNFEKKVAESIREQAAQRGLEDKFTEIMVPTEQVGQPALLGLLADRIRHLVLEVRVGVDGVPAVRHVMHSAS